MRNTLLFLCVGGILGAASGVGCGGGSSGSAVDMAQVADMTAMNCPTGVLCATSVVTDQTLDLNAQSIVTVKVTANAGYSGTVNVTVDRPAIDALSGGKSPDVNIAVVPGTFQLTGGNTMPVTVKLSTTTAAAAFQALPVTLHVTDMADATKKFDVKFNLTVTNNLTITLNGAGTGASLHSWSTDQGATNVNGSLVIQVRQRPGAMGGTNFAFLNKDTNPHLIHGQGVIPHQDPAGTGTSPNGVYPCNSVNNTLVIPIPDNFYCHTHGISGNAAPATERLVSFIP